MRPGLREREDGAAASCRARRRSRRSARSSPGARSTAEGARTRTSRTTPRCRTSRGRPCESSSRAARASRRRRARTRGACSTSRSSACGCSPISERNSAPLRRAAVVCSQPQLTTRSRPSTRTRSISRSSRQDDDVRRQPDREPAHGRERAGSRAGTSVAARIASSNDAPSAWRFRTASIIVSVLPARAPLGPRATPSRISISRPPRRIRAVGETGARHRVGDERDAPGGGAPDDARGLGREVDPVEDDLDDDVIPGEGGAGDPGIPMPERAHRVEEVRHACARRRRRRRSPRRPSRPSGRTRRRSRVGAGVSISAVGAGELGCERHQTDGPRGEQASRAVPRPDPGARRRDGSRGAGGRGTALRDGRRGCGARPRSAGTSRRAARSCCSGAVMKVGR